MENKIILSSVFVGSMFWCDIAGGMLPGEQISASNCKTQALLYRNKIVKLNGKIPFTLNQYLGSRMGAISFNPQDFVSTWSYIQQLKKEKKEVRERARLEMLCDYSKIPDNLYAGEPGIRSGKKFGEALKNVLEISKDCQRLQTEDQLLDLWSARSLNLLEAIDIHSFAHYIDRFAKETNKQSFVELYRKGWSTAKEYDVKKMLWGMDNYQYSLDYYLQVLAIVILYINDNPKTRFNMFFDNIKLLTSEMLKYYLPKI